MGYLRIIKWLLAVRTCCYCQFCPDQSIMGDLSRWCHCWVSDDIELGAINFSFLRMLKDICSFKTCYLCFLYELHFSYLCYPKCFTMFLSFTQTHSNSELPSGGNSVFTLLLKDTSECWQRKLGIHQSCAPVKEYHTKLMQQCNQMFLQQVWVHKQTHWICEKTDDLWFRDSETRLGI